MRFHGPEAYSTTCWNVGRFCQFVGLSVMPPSGSWTMLSAHHWSPAEQVESAGYTVAADSAAACVSELSSALRQADRLPPPQYATGSGSVTLCPSTLRRSLLT